MASTLTISWSKPTSLASCTDCSFQYKYALSTDSLDNATPVSVAFNVLTATIGGLTNNATYNYAVRTICGPVQSKWSYGSAVTCNTVPIDTPTPTPTPTAGAGQPTATPTPTPTQTASVGQPTATPTATPTPTPTATSQPCITGDNSVYGNCSGSGLGTFTLSSGNQAIVTPSGYFYSGTGTRYAYAYLRTSTGTNIQSFTLTMSGSTASFSPTSYTLSTPGTYQLYVQQVDCNQNGTGGSGTMSLSVGNCSSAPTPTPTPTSTSILQWYIPLYTATTLNDACSSSTLVNGYYDGTSLSVGDYLYTSNTLQTGLPNGWYWYDSQTVYQINDQVDTGQIVDIQSCITGGGSGGSGSMYDCLGGACTQTVSGTYDTLIECQNSGCGSQIECFIEGTMVTLSDGTQKPIEQLVIGDTLKSYNIDTLPLYSDDETVLNTWSSSNITGNYDVATVTSIIPDTSHGVWIINNLLKTTGRHRHLIKRDGVWSFIEAYQVVVGDIMLDINNNEVEVTSKTTDSSDYTIYKLDVENLDVFYANDILTHNLKNTD